MRQTEKAAREMRFRIKGTFGLVLLGGFLGAMGWAWRATGGDVDLLILVRVFSISSANPYFWTVVGLCGTLGGWLAWVFFWRRIEQPEAPAGRGPDGMSAPKF